MTSQEDLPKVHRALLLTSTDKPPTVETIPTPQPGAGIAIVRILAAGVISYSREIYNGARQYAYPTPFVPGTSAIGRIAAVGPDATLLTPGQLVYVEGTIRGRDDPNAAFLSGVHEGHTDGSRRLTHGEWRDSTYAEYAKIPLENCHPLNEKRLLGGIEEGGLGYTVEHLVYIASLLVPYGGLRDIELKSGETIVVAPATGGFGGAAVEVSLAMGARVIAMGRKPDALKRVASAAGNDNKRVETVQITGNMQVDTEALKSFGGPVDAFFDISPVAAAKSTHIKSCILSLKHGGRGSLMGGVREDTPIPLLVVMRRNLQLKGRWMYPREAISELIKMVEVGVLKLGSSAGGQVVGKYGLEDWKKAFDAAAENPGVVVIAP